MIIDTEKLRKRIKEHHENEIKARPWLRDMEKSFERDELKALYIIEDCEENYD